VQPGAVGPSRVDLQFDQGALVVPDDGGADDRPLRPPADQGGVVGDAVAAVRGDVADRLDQVGLALPVGSDEGADPRLQLQVHGPVGPVVGQLKVGDVHLAAPTEADRVRAAVCANPEGAGRPCRPQAVDRGTYSAALVTACPPNWLRSAAMTFIAGLSSCREANRAYSAAVMTGAGTAWSTAA